MSTTSDQNAGRVAVITGASSGIGEATARALAASGYRLALLARRADRIQALADELGNGAIAIQADVTDRDSIVKAADRVKAELGGTDVLVNNAGVMLLAPFNRRGTRRPPADDRGQPARRHHRHRGRSSTSSATAAATWSTCRPWPAAPPAPATPSTPPPSGESTAGRNHCARSCSPACGSWSSSPAPSRPS